MLRTMSHSNLPRIPIYTLKTELTSSDVVVHHHHEGSVSYHVSYLLYPGIHGFPRRRQGPIITSSLLSSPSATGSIDKPCSLRLSDSNACVELV